MRHVRSIFGSLGTSGSAAVEFALVTPIYLLLTFSISEIGMASFADLVLQNAVQASGRLIRTGQAQAQGMSQSQFRANVCARISFIMNCDAGNLLMDIRSFTNFGGANLPAPIDQGGNVNPNLNAYQIGSSSLVNGQNPIVVVRVFYKWPLHSPGFSEVFSNAGNDIRLISSSVAFRNEPY